MADVYIAGSLRHAPKEWWKIYEKIGDVVKKFGLKPHIPHLNTTEDVKVVVKGYSDNEIHNPDLSLETRAKVFQRSFEAVTNSTLIIAEVTRPSIGTGIEIGFALQHNKPIICLAQKDVDITSMVLGPVHLGKIEIIRYSDEEDALNKLEGLLSQRFNNLTK